MTSSFVEILARHDGPWKLFAAMGADAKGRPLGAWVPEKTAEPIDDAFALMDKGGIEAVAVWSMSEQQFCVTVEPSDRRIWDVEREDWRAKARTLTRETSAEIAKTAPPVRLADDVTPDVMRQVLKLRATMNEKGRPMGYVAIEIAMGQGDQKKGFWTMKILRAAAGILARGSADKE